MKKLFENLSRIGTSSSYTSQQALDNQIINLVLYLGFAMAVPYPFCINSFNPSALPVAIGICFMYQALFVLNYVTDQHSWLKLLVGTSSSIAHALFHLHLFAPGDAPIPSLLLVQFGLFSIPWFLFSIKETSYSAAATLINAIIFYYLLNTDGLNAFGSSEALKVSNWNHYFYIISFIYTYACIYLLKWANHQSKLRNKRLVVDLTEKQQNMEKQSAELNKYVLEIKNKCQNDESRKWVSDGIAQLSAQLKIGTSFDDIKNKLLSNLIRYLSANQGALYLLKDDAEKKYLELTACYAYNRTKYLNQKIQLGQGLVGQACLEKDTIYLTEIPESYMKITSGVGEALPSAILIVPLIHNQNVQGALELASFHPFKKEETEVAELIAEHIASFIEHNKVTKRMEQLLEESRNKSKKMQVQEEAMRSNMEELMTAQEETRARTINFEELILKKNDEIRALKRQLEGTA
ncbi:MAG: GAF domain-containing protein [Cytophagales bacterium]|nr:GAF domain-containing protein [Cytophagales bacterium]